MMKVDFGKKTSILRVFTKISELFPKTLNFIHLRENNSAKHLLEWKPQVKNAKNALVLRENQENDSDFIDF